MTHHPGKTTLADHYQVIVAVARIYRHLAPPSHLSTIAGPLISLVRAPIDIQHMALINIVSIALSHPQPFSKFATHFLVHASDPPHIWRLKLEVLTLIFSHTTTHTKNLILSELEYFAQSHDKDLVKEAVRAIGRCAQNRSKNAARCLRLLLRLVESEDGTLVAESLTVIRHIIQQSPSTHSTTVVRLAKALDTATNPSARASIIWLVGEFAGVNNGNNIAADTLRILSKTFALESEETKLQIVLLAAKVYAHHLNSHLAEEENHPVALLFSYIMLLARYDLSYDLRDRARLYKSILSVPASIQLAALLLLAPKPTPLAPSPSLGREEYTLGSAAMVVGKGEDVNGYRALAGWVSVSRAPSPSLREGSNADVGETVTAASGRGMAIAKGRMGAGSPGMGSPAGAGSPVWRPEGAKPQVENGKVETLEDFLASDESEEDEDEDEDEDDEESEGDDEDEDESEEEEESEDEGGEGSGLLGKEK